MLGTRPLVSGAVDGEDGLDVARSASTAIESAPDLVAGQPPGTPLGRAGAVFVASRTWLGGVFLPLVVTAAQGSVAKSRGRLLEAHADTEVERIEALLLAEGQIVVAVEVAGVDEA